VWYISAYNLQIPNTKYQSYLYTMEVLVLFVLLIFMALFLGGGILLVKGLLASRPKQWITGIVLLLLCIVFMYIAKQIPGIY
jgi:hypothetical protein